MISFFIYKFSRVKSTSISLLCHGGAEGKDGPINDVLSEEVICTSVTECSLLLEVLNRFVQWFSMTVKERWNLVPKIFVPNLIEFWSRLKWRDNSPHSFWRADCAVPLRALRAPQHNLSDSSFIPQFEYRKVYQIRLTSWRISNIAKIQNGSN